jgi:FKBP-type peptidyl-prolyl cis-trans isomerase
VVKGWTQGLSGQSVGSQVLLIIPPDLGYGSTAQEKIPANSTLYFVVDILHIDS